ncbi:MAG: flagellar basal body rod protein FlgB, partial [Candidatus Omnitrophica bacterium]|nr:flagellar basal body rod protein FlgB [Candidatus Omnitrophota bacterium]
EGQESAKIMIQHIFRGNQTPNVLLAALDGQSARQGAIVNNIVNVDTPGYRRVEVSFEEELQKEVARMRPERASDGSISTDSVDRPLGDFAAKVSIDMSTPVRFDGSNVRIDREMVELAKATGKINQLTELLIRQHRMTRSAILGRNI